MLVSKRIITAGGYGAGIRRHTGAERAPDIKAEGAQLLVVWDRIAMSHTRQNVESFQADSFWLRWKFRVNCLRPWDK